MKYTYKGKECVLSQETKDKFDKQNKSWVHVENSSAALLIIGVIVFGIYLVYSVTS